MVCKGIECVKLKAKKPFNMGRYSSGQSRCQICEIYMVYDGIYCPCCGTRLRKVPRSLKYKARLRAIKV